MGARRKTPMMKRLINVFCAASRSSAARAFARSASAISCLVALRLVPSAHKGHSLTVSLALRSSAQAKPNPRPRYQSRGWSRDVLVPGKADGGDDRSRNDESRGKAVAGPSILFFSRTEQSEEPLYWPLLLPVLCRRFITTKLLHDPEILPRTLRNLSRASLAHSLVIHQVRPHP